jgi:hypothetical protein
MEKIITIDGRDVEYNPTEFVSIEKSKIAWLYEITEQYNMRIELLEATLINLLLVVGAENWECQGAIDSALMLLGDEPFKDIQ